MSKTILQKHAARLGVNTADAGAAMGIAIGTLQQSFAKVAPAAHDGSQFVGPPVLVYPRQGREYAPGARPVPLTQDGIGKAQAIAARIMGIDYPAYPHPVAVRYDAEAPLRALERYNDAHQTC